MPGKKSGHLPCFKVFQARRKTEENQFWMFSSEAGRWNHPAKKRLGVPVVVANVGPALSDVGKNPFHPMFCHHFDRISGDAVFLIHAPLIKKGLVLGN